MIKKIVFLLILTVSLNGCSDDNDDCEEIWLYYQDQIKLQEGNQEAQDNLRAEREIKLFEAGCK